VENVSLTMAVGEWRIDVKAYQDTGLAGTGSVTLAVGPGSNSVRVPMNMSGPCYEITVSNDTIHGTVRSNFTAAFAGTRITMTAEEDADAVFIDGTLQAKVGPGTVASGSGASYSFTMPAADVEVSAEFKQFVRYVREGESGYGTSWEDASGDLQEMMDELEALTIPGYTGPRIVKLGAGTYIPEWKPSATAGTYDDTGDSRDRAFILRNGVQVWGGYPASGGEDSSRNVTANKTTLSGDLDNSGGIPDNNDAYHIVLGVNIPPNTGTVLDGLTISGGNADGGGTFSVDSVSIPRSNSGGMYTDNASPKLNRVTISGNVANVDGGGMYNFNGSSPKLVNVTISDNHITSGGGGGMFNHESSPELEDVTISYNISPRGGGINNSYGSSPTLTNVTISNNTATSGHGGGIYNIGSSTEPVLKDVTISNNTASGSGGGMYSEASSPVLTNVTISDNTADGGNGGGMYNSGGNPVLINVSISGNHASFSGGGSFAMNSTVSAGNGGGIYNTGGDPVLINVNISGNYASEGGGSSFSGSNSTFFAGNGGGIYNTGGDPVLINVNISGNNATEGGGNSGTVTNSNFFTGNGGGAFNDSGNPVLINVTIAGNTTATGGSNTISFGTGCVDHIDKAGGLFNTGSADPQIRNSIIWGNTAADSSSPNIFNNGGIPKFAYSIVEGSGNPWNIGSSFDGGNNKDEDPQFSADYHLNSGSPAVNAGSNGLYSDIPSVLTGITLSADAQAAVTTALQKDLGGNIRTQGGTIDMGAYERQ
jgi:predicted outer membrane repeat protein